MRPARGSNSSAHLLPLDGFVRELVEYVVGLLEFFVLFFIVALILDEHLREVDEKLGPP